MYRVLLVLAFLLTVPALMIAPTYAVERGEVVFDFGNGTSEEDRAIIREGIRFAQEFAIRELGGAIQETLYVNAAPDSSALYSAWATGRTITFATDNEIWVESSAFHKLKITVHEYIHLLQFDLSNLRPGGPIWLLEGSAEYLAYYAVSQLGLVDWNAVLDRWVYSTLYRPEVASVPLIDIENPSPEVYCCLTEIAPLAVHYLLQGIDLSALRSYYEAIGSSSSSGAFADAFRQPIEDFYDAFAAIRTQLVVAGYDQTVLQYPTWPVQGVGDVWGVTVSSPVARGGQAFLRAMTAPGIACTLTFTSASGNHLLTQPTHALPDGSVFWLWSVRTRLAEGDARADVTCGTNTVSVPVTLT